MTTRGERGAVTVEFVLLLPVLLLLAGIVIAGARLEWARSGVEQLHGRADLFLSDIELIGNALVHRLQSNTHGA